jgi:hypothetical protein
MSPHKITLVARILGTCIAAGLILPGLSGFMAEEPALSGAGRADYAPWWDYSWFYRMPLILDNTANAKALADHQVLLNFSGQELIDAGKMRADRGDMRFADTDGVTPLRYWEETEGNIWLKVPSIPASSKKTIYFYYGNPSAASASNGSQTFEVFDQFDGNSIDTSKWQLMHAGTYSVANGLFTIAADGSYQPGKAIAITASQENNIVLRSKLKITGGTHVDERIGLSIKCGRGDGRGYNYVLRDFTGLDEISFLDDFVTWNSRAGNWQKNTWYVEEICHDGSGVRGRLNDGAWQSQAWSGRSGYPALYYGSYDGVSVWDWALVRKYTSPDPKLTFGPEEHPIKFIGADCSHEQANEGDVITLNITFNNPTNDPIAINITFWQGEDFAEAARIGDTHEVVLEPNRNTLTQQEWKAVGGNTVLWVSLGRSVLASFPVSVNWYPTLDYIPDQQLLQDQPYVLKFTAKDKGGDALVWREDSPLFNFTKTNSTGAEASVKPTNDQVGSYTINVSVTDPRGCSDNRTFRITVENINDPPWLEHIPGLVAYEDQRYSYRVNATDPDIKWGDSLTFSDDCGLFDIDPRNGNFSFTPTNAQVGKYYIEISVRDNQSVTSTRTFNLSVQNTNDPPVIEPIPPQTATQGKLWQVMARASDIDQTTPQGDKLRFSDDSPLFDISPESGLITFTPGNGHIGLWSCNVSVTDIGGATCSTRLSLTVLNVNDPPAMESILDLTATEDVLFEYTAKAKDPDVPLKLDNLTFSDDTQLFDIDPKTGKFSFTPTNAQVGKHTIRITVKDESGASAGRTFLLTVLNVNDPPFNVSITSLSPGEKYREGRDIWLNGTGSDEDAGDRLTYVWLDNDVEVGRGKSIQVKLGPGDHRITLKVSDGNAEATAEVAIKVSKVQKEQVTVQNNWLLPPAIIVIIAAAAGGALFAVKRSKRSDEPEEHAPREAVDSLRPTPPVAAAATGAAAAGAAQPAKAPPVIVPPVKPQDKDRRDRARKALDAAEDAVADALEAGADTAAAEESLDIAKDFFKDGDYDEAVTYAKEAESALNPAGKKAGKAPAAGKLTCPECGEALQPEWPACPVCGHRTR